MQCIGKCGTSVQVIRAARMLALLSFVLPLSMSGQMAMTRNTNPVYQMMRLGRQDRFDEAVALGRSVAQQSEYGKSGTSERCAFLVALSYLEVRAEHRAESQAAVDTFAGECNDVPGFPAGARAEVARVRRVLGGEAVTAVYPPRAARAVATTPGARTSAVGLPTLPVDRGAASLPIGPARAAATDLPSGDAFALGLDTVALGRHRGLCIDTAADACLVLYQGYIVQEWYGPRYKEPTYAMSSTKSITGILIGMLIDDGKLPGLDVRACAYLPDWCEGIRGRVTLRHLMSMTSGLPNMQNQRSVGFKADKNPYVRSLVPEAEPGEVWAYSNEGVQLLSPILDAAAGEPIQDYAKRRLFEPLGMTSTRLHVDSAGHAWTYADMLTTPRDFAKLGQLMLQRGKWNGKQIVSAAWVDSSAVPSQTLNRTYGLLWWTAMPGETRFASLGYRNTDMQIMPNEQLVVVRMQNSEPATAPRVGYTPEAFDLFTEFVKKPKR